MRYSASHHRTRLTLAALVAITSILAEIPSLAQNFLPSTYELTAKAGENRVAFISELGNLQMHAAHFARPKDLEPYLLSLDALDVIGKNLGVDSLGGDPVASTGVELCRQYVKWLSFEKDQPETISAFFKWADNDSRYMALRTQGDLLMRITNPDVVKHWAQRISDVSLQLKEFQVPVFVNTAVDELSALAVSQFLSSQFRPSEKEMSEIIRTLSSEPSLRRFLDYVEGSLESATSENEIKLLLGWGILSNQHSKDAQIPLQLETRLRLQRALVATTMRLVQKNAAPDPSLASDIVELLDDSPLNDLSESFESVRLDRASPRLRSFMQRTLPLLIDRLTVTGEEAAVSRLTKLFSRLMVSESMRTMNVEGIYTGTVSGDDVTLTVADVGAENFIMCLNRSRRGIDTSYSMFHVAYDLDQQAFESNRFAVDDPQYAYSNQPNWGYQFRFNPESTQMRISGTFINPVEEFIVRAERSRTLNRPETAANYPVQNIAGRYSGPFPGMGTGTLHISQVGTKISGMMRLANGGVTVDLNYGYLNTTKGTFYLTTWEHLLGKWIQIRGYFSNADELHFDYIVGCEIRMREGVVFRRVGLPRHSLN